eukprot:TRINITY_DN4219_c0_g1_i1.p1 TRINITY_DN4219_c0_g1~~TRINITY_DN4219_c0_g1_i1.p1  ORF type:complete len:242 (-),score=30.78 TRINITY_DN4219_c0_g1_i1:50-775(-)
MFLGITFPPQPLSLITEFCERGGLYEHLRVESVSDAMKMNLILGIARGILHLHSEGVIHRDLACRNVLLDRGLEPKVSDFGLSREHSDAATAAKTMTTLGPLKWMAPESIFQQDYSIKTDSFSFGVVVWEIITVQDPWAGLTPMDASLQIKEGNRLEIPTKCNPILSRIMKECWMENPEERPDFSAVLCILDSLQSIPPTYSSPPAFEHGVRPKPSRLIKKQPQIPQDPEKVLIEDYDQPQ